MNVSFDETRLCDISFYDLRFTIHDLLSEHQFLTIYDSRFTIHHFEMTPKEIAAQYEAKVFDAPEAAKVAGFVLTDKLEPRNVWNKASAAQAIVTKLAKLREGGEAKEIGLIIESWSVTGCYVPAEPGPGVA